MSSDSFWISCGERGFSPVYLFLDFPLSTPLDGTLLVVNWSEDNDINLWNSDFKF